MYEFLDEKGYYEFDAKYLQYVGSNADHQKLPRCLMNVENFISLDSTMIFGNEESLYVFLFDKILVGEPKKIASVLLYLSIIIF